MGNENSRGFTAPGMPDSVAAIKYIELFCPYDTDAILFGPPNEKLTSKLSAYLISNYIYLTKTTGVNMIS